MGGELPGNEGDLQAQGVEVQTLPGVARVLLRTDPAVEDRDGSVSVHGGYAVDHCGSGLDLGGSAVDHNGCVGVHVGCIGDVLAHRTPGYQGDKRSAPAQCPS